MAPFESKIRSSQRVREMPQWVVGVGRYGYTVQYYSASDEKSHFFILELLTEFVCKILYLKRQLIRTNMYLVPSIFLFTAYRIICDKVL